MRNPLHSVCFLMIFILLSPHSSAAPLVLAKQGQSLTTIVAASDAHAAADRLGALMQLDADVTPTTLPAGKEAQRNQARIVLCTVKTRGEVTKLLSKRARRSALKPDGFLIESNAADGGQVTIIGADTAGLRCGIGELWNYHIQLDGTQARIEAPLWIEDAPAFSKRIFWNWDFLTNWDDDLSRIHQTTPVDPGGKRQPYLEQPDGYEKQFKRVIDYAADHKLNGLIIYGFINDNHGGVASAQRLSAYAKTHSVRVLPGVGTVIYGGYVHSSNDPNNPHSLTTWLANNPKVRRMVGKDGKTIDSAPCPSSPELHEFLVNGAKWFFTTFKDIGGVNLEHGDFFECACDVCKAERAKPENDHNFLWDMMHTQVPVIKTGLEINSDLWFTFSPYWGYNKEMMANPPKFIGQYPEQSIIQWTYTGMASSPIDQHWPADLKPPAGAKHSIGLLHQGSYWSEPKPWWASAGGTYALVIDVIQQACARAIDDGSEGLEIVGQIGTASPQNELNYLAFEEFTWHPKMSKTAWINDRLARIYGTAELAHRFCELVEDDTTSPEKTAAHLELARKTVSEVIDPRQITRWKNLTRELTRRAALIKAGQTKPFGPGPLTGVEELKIDF